ncbi:hypothetical protein RF11_12552 [Thelohanellus kitauei]|uniref:Uncharacterized protein n=1 Tax=Thelohanellus kitauei TaxID=669202 RepID=A0A0C2IVG1_THEKT|nr:hypothetical protein RF11_12552 [Thelohanellus kitauei]
MKRREFTIDLIAKYDGELHAELYTLDQKIKTYTQINQYPQTYLTELNTKIRELEDIIKKISSAFTSQEDSEISNAKIQEIQDEYKKNVKEELQKLMEHLPTIINQLTERKRNINLDIAFLQKIQNQIAVG